MTPSEANNIDLNCETNLETLRALVKYWQNLAYLTELRISKLQPGFTLDKLEDNDGNETK